MYAICKLANHGFADDPGVTIPVHPWLAAIIPTTGAALSKLVARCLVNRVIIQEA